MKTMQMIPPGSGVYIITCSGNNKFYIGSSENLRNRYEKHSSDCKYCSFKVDAMNEDVKHYGADSFKFDVLCLCNNKVLTIVENHYIKLYDAKINGYNSNYASINMKTKSRYNYVANNNYGKLVLEGNRLLDEYLIKMLDLTDNKKTYVTFYELYNVFNEIVFESENAGLTLNIIEKLDYNCYIEPESSDDGIIYKFSGKEIRSLMNGGTYFKSFKELSYEFKRRLFRKIDIKKIFIEIDNIRDNLSIDYQYNYKCINEHDIVDLRYTPYNIDINKY